MLRLMMEAVSTSETSVNFYQTTTWCNVPENSHLPVLRIIQLRKVTWKYLLQTWGFSGFTQKTTEYLSWTFRVKGKRGEVSGSCRELHSE